VVTISTLQQLKSLQVHGNALVNSHLLGALGHLTNLERMCMCCSPDADESFNVSLDLIGGLTALEQLCIRSCRGVTSLAPLSSLHALKQLHLTDLQQVSSLHPLGALSGLTYLHLEGCPSTTDATALHGLTALQHLNLLAVGNHAEQPAGASMPPGLSAVQPRNWWQDFFSVPGGALF
jgi:hypothetical protein